MPRFSATPQVPPPTSGPVRLRIGPRGDDGIALDLDDLMDVGSVNRRLDLHCVTTWSYRGALWTGVPLVDVWSALVAPRAGAAADHPYVVAVGADRYRAVLRREDLVQPEVLLAWALDGRPIEGRHGGPLRLVSPRQYGYKSVKHLIALQPCSDRPSSRLGAKEHLRARVALEERHARWPGRLLRLPYRLTVVPTALLAERSLAAACEAEDPETTRD